MMRRTGYLVILRARKPRRVLSNSAARLSRHSGERRSSPSSQPTWAVSAFCAQNRRPGRQYCAQKVPRLPAGSPQPQLLSSLLGVRRRDASHRLSRRSGERRSSPSSQPTWAVSAFCAQNRRPGRQYCAQKVPRLPAGSPQPQLLSSLLGVRRRDASHRLLIPIPPWTAILRTEGGSPE